MQNLIPSSNSLSVCGKLNYTAPVEVLSASNKYKKSTKNIPQDLRKRTEKAINKILTEGWNAGGIRPHKLRQNPGLGWLSINDSHRVIYRMRGNTMELLEFGTHEQMETTLRHYK